MNRYCLRAIVGMSVFALIFTVAIHAQQLATLNVTVTDQSGAVIPNAKVTVRNIETDAKRTESTNGDGLAVIPGLAPGKYELSVESGQFTPHKSQVTLAVGQIASAAVTLGLSTKEQKVEVFATTEGIDTQKSEVSQVIESQKILDLPISGRDFIDFVLLTPTANVGRSTAIGAQSPFTETVLQLSFAGMR